MSLTTQCKRFALYLSRFAQTSLFYRATPLLASLIMKHRQPRLFSTIPKPINGQIHENIKTNLVNLTVNGKQISAPKGSSILEACRLNHISIPSLCWHPDLCVGGNCRICLVEYAKDSQSEYDNKLKHACGVIISDGIKVRTNTQKVRDNVRAQLKFMRLSHSGQCLTCMVNGKCELQDLCFRYKVDDDLMDAAYEKHLKAKLKRMYPQHPDNKSRISSNVITFEPDKCVLCQRCVRTCKELQGMCILGSKLRGGNMKISTFGDLSLDGTTCLQCGQCTLHCPVGAIHEKDSVHQVMDLIDNNYDKNKIIICSTAPSIRVAISEEFGDDPGTINTKQMISACRQCGFNYVFDTNFTADLTIIEEGTEFINRLNGNAIDGNNTLPMFTSCCPGWINMVEKVYPQLIPHLSSCKSPQGMMGSLIKNYIYNKHELNKKGYSKKDIINVSIMPCVAKKDEIIRPQLIGDVDYVLTTREFARLCKNYDVHWHSLPCDDSVQFDSIMGEASGAAIIFGATGGVMEAALRTAYELVMKQTLPKIDFHDVRGLDGVKEAIIMLGDLPLKVAVVHQGREIRNFIDNKKYLDYDFIEIMMCKGGCIGGGGQPKSLDPNVLIKRINSIYEIDKELNIRKSHENKEVNELYKDFLGEPNGHKAHELLHTHYKDRSKDVIGR